MQVIGFTSVPGAGDSFIVVDEDRVARQIAERRPRPRAQGRARPAAASGSRSEDLDAALKEINQLNLIIKGDNSGTVEALEDSLLKIDVGDDVELRVIHRGVGGITQGDINLAIADNVIVLGFNVRAEGKATELANREGVDIRYYTVIYQAIDEIEAALKGLLKPEFEEVELGPAEVREVFRSSEFGNIAGCLVQSGEIRRNAKARLLRDRSWSSPTTCRSTRCGGSRTTSSRSARASNAVSASGSCNNIKVGDVIETFEMREKAAPDGDGLRRRDRCPASRPARPRSVMALYVGALELDVLLGDVHSLKQKRSLVRPVVAELRRRFEVAVAEAGHLDLHRRSLHRRELSSPPTTATSSPCSTAASVRRRATRAGVALVPAPDARARG